MTDKKAEKITGLDLMREPFEAHLVSKLPKQTKRMTEAKKEYKNCKICGGYHHPQAVHLDYVGHAALTHRLLDCDPEWSWKPVALDERGLPLLDANGGMWIGLTVCGVTRLGYGYPDAKKGKGGDAIKEIIGDALRNAAMRFGAALDLWHKGDLHNAQLEADKREPEPADKPVAKKSAPKPDYVIQAEKVIKQIKGCTDIRVLEKIWLDFKDVRESIKVANTKTHDYLEGKYSKEIAKLKQNDEKEAA